MIEVRQDGTVTVELTDDEMRNAALIGVERQIYGVMRKRQHLFSKDQENGWQGNIVGALGECVVAKWLGRYWNGNFRNFKAADVGKLQVRASTRDDAPMRIYEKDKDDDVFFLVTGAGPVFTIRGWRRAGDCKRQEWWGEPKPWERMGMFYVPQDALRPARRAGDGSAPGGEAAA